MKTKALSVLLILIAIVISATIAKASDIDSARVEKKVIKIVTVDDRGTIMIDSTFTTKDGKVTVHVDSTRYPCIPHGGKGIRHEGKNRMMYWKDDSGETYNIEVLTDDDSTHVVVNGEPMGEPFEMSQGSGSFPCHKKMMIMHGGDNFPVPPVPPVPPCHFPGQKSLIDLNDPTIISFEKKVQKDGTEKITIIRKLE